MVKITEAIGQAAEYLKQPGKMDEHIRVTSSSDPDLGYLLTMFASGQIGKVEREIKGMARNPGAARNLNKMMMDASGESFLKGLIFGLLISDQGISFDDTPEGVKLRMPQGRMTH